MPLPSPTFPLRRTLSLPWRRLTDDEWAALTQILRPGERGRTPRLVRRSWDGIFWVACSIGPWREMPPDFGRPDTAHRTLRRAAAAGHLHALLVAVSDHPLAPDSPLRAIAWYIVRAFRRAFRLAPHAISFARRLGLASALPAEPAFLPNPHLSENVTALARGLWPAGHWPGWEVAEALQFLMEKAGGKPRMWKTTG